MTTIVSTIGTAPYGTSKYLVDIIQPTLNKNKHCVINSSSFVNEAAICEHLKKKFNIPHWFITFGSIIRNLFITSGTQRNGRSPCYTNTTENI